MRQVFAITRKELEGYFGSPMALIFVGAYLAVTLFVFFWADAFFARGLADVRPLFRWTPVLLIFLVAALTMRAWSEEQRSGTLELLLTLPLSPTQLALAKFLAVMAQVTVALALTLFLPITVSLLGDLDWGPVIGGYLAAVLLAAAYAALGLLISSRTDNQIVALITTSLGCGLLYLLGSRGLTTFFGSADAILRALGTGSRFESIQRGVVDLRDLVYYLSLTTLFLSLNVLSLSSLRWSRGMAARPQRLGQQVTSALLALNLLLLNIWLYPLRGLRLDLTAQRQYTLSRATRELLAGLQEPLLIRGYFSENTHPLLAPLAPTIADMLEEYRIAGGGRVQVEVIDPAQYPEKEQEANQVYGIRPTPFQVQGRYETSIINSYFDILVRYGDQSATLGFRDLIEVSARSDGTVDVGLRNLEYDLTRTVKKVAYGFQSVEAVLAALDAPARLTLYVTPDTLPASLAEAPETIRRVAEELASRSEGRLVYQVVDVDASPNAALRQTLLEEHGIQPLAASLFSLQTFYLHMVLQAGERSEVVFPSGDLSEANVRSALEAAIRRSAPGFLQVVGLWTPPQASQQQMYGLMPSQSLSSWTTVGQYLRQEYEVRALDLTSEIPPSVDVLVVVAPQDLADVQRYVIDQYLMRGGTVIVAAGSYGIVSDPFGGGLALQPLEGGLREMLAHYGVQVEQRLVMDPQNEPFPVTVMREVEGIQFQEIRAIPYPFFVDVRSDGMAAGHPIVSNLAAITLNWASPVSAQEAEAAGRQVTMLLQSSPKSWTQSSTDIQPNLTLYPELGFPQGEDVGRKTLAVAVQGVFDSAFQGQEPPLAEDGSPVLPATPIPRSPESARLVVLGSAEFLDDLVFDISSRLTMDRYLNSLTLMQNAVAWATEDQALLEIRARGSYTRVLRPLSRGAQSFWEGANYAVALVALLAIGATWNARRRSQQPLPLLTPEELARHEEVTA